MNYLWGIMILIGVIYGAFTGNLAEITEQSLSSAKEAVSLCITMAGVMAFWAGMMEIAQDVGLIRGLSRALSPILSLLFPALPKDHPARPHMAANIIANLFGLGWAATPAGLSAMKELQAHRSEREAPARKQLPHRLEADPSRASSTMCDFLILNISSLQLIPVNIVAYRSQYGSANPSAIIGPAILATLLSTACAILFIRVRYLFHIEVYKC